MTENYPKSKLKRKKSSVEELHWQTAPKAAPATPASSSGGGTAQAVRSVVPVAAWWKREQLPPVENLWMLTLKSALLYLENHHWDRVPDLPHPSILKPTALKSDEQQWCDLQEEVAPFPEPALPWSPDPLGLSSSHLSVQSRTVTDPPDRQRSSHSKQSLDGETASVQSLTKETRPSLHNWEEAASSVGYSDFGREERRNGRKQEEPQTVAVSRQQMRVSDRRDLLQKDCENKAEVVKDKTVQEAQASFRGDGGGGGGGGEGGRLQTCPMCLMVFPVGFTQMDCDGHLAQCLSEMNMDMTW